MRWPCRRFGLGTKDGVVQKGLLIRGGEACELVDLPAQCKPYAVMTHDSELRWQ